MFLVCHNGAKEPIQVNFKKWRGIGHGSGRGKATGAKERRHGDRGTEREKV